MESMQSDLSYLFYLGLLAITIGVVLIYRAKGQRKTMEKGYFILILGVVGVISEWMDFAAVMSGF